MASRSTSRKSSLPSDPNTEKGRVLRFRRRVEGRCLRCPEYALRGLSYCAYHYSKHAETAETPSWEMGGSYYDPATNRVIG